ncbi:MAG: 16S rRNA (guanine(966)-N(2))-methyltransferase RsmD [Chloroflexota bacterium]
MSARPTDDRAGRVIAGTARGIRLVAPGDMTRPLSDRVKQTLFAILDPQLREGAVLDLFAGSGAAGIESLSRGAASAVFVERDRRAAATIRENLARTRLAGPPAVVVETEALAWLRSPDADRAGPWDVVIVDPPYDQPDLLVAALERLGRTPRLVATNGIVMAKHFWRDQPPDQMGLLASERVRRFGDTALTFYRLANPAEAST